MIVNKDDMRRLLNDIGRVHYIHIIDGKIHSEDDGLILEVFSHTSQSTLIANHSIYLNLESFDYLQLNKTDESQSCFDLIQDNRKLRLIPLTNYLQEQDNIKDLDPETFEAMMTEVLSAKLDLDFDDEFPF
jgi:hypothetical protein